MLNLNFSVARGPAAPTPERIALVTGSYEANVDGVALTLNRLMSHALRSGHEVLVLSPALGRRRRLIVPAGDVQHVPSISLPVWSEYRLTWGLGRTARAALDAFAPTVVHIAVPDMMGHSAQRWARRRNVPVLCSHHTRWNVYLNYYRLLPTAPLERLMWWGMRRFHRGCDITLPPSEAVAAELRERAGVQRLAIWPRGVDTTLFNPDRRSSEWRLAALNSSEATASSESSTNAETIEKVIVLLVSRLRWEKGLEAFASTVHEAQAMLDSRAASAPHPRTRVQLSVVVVGGGPARAAFSKLLPSGTVFLGMLTGEALATAYASADLFLNPSSTEGWGATCLEAQASGVPVLATRSSGITDVVAHGVGGLLVPPANVSALAKAVVELAADADLRERVGRDAVSHAARFSWKQSGDLVLRQYKALTRTPR